MQIKKEDATYIDTPVEITGSESEIERAKELIEETINPPVSSITSRMAGRIVHVDVNIIM